jgi:hypothetical protein
MADEYVSAPVCVVKIDRSARLIPRMSAAQPSGSLELVSSPNARINRHSQSTDALRGILHPRQNEIDLSQYANASGVGHAGELGSFRIFNAAPRCVKHADLDRPDEAILRTYCGHKFAVLRSRQPVSNNLLPGSARPMSM